jgi:hypothetical protein
MRPVLIKFIETDALKRCRRIHSSNGADGIPIAISIRHAFLDARFTKALGANIRIICINGSGPHPSPGFTLVQDRFLESEIGGVPSYN